eukprot:COSAG01_NODE_2502_length_7556_cov_78.108220_6_plen_83_part_00
MQARVESTQWVALKATRVGSTLGVSFIITHSRLHFFGDPNSSIYGRSFPWLSPCSHAGCAPAGFHCQNQPIDLSRSIQAATA